MALPPVVQANDLIGYITRNQHQIEFFQLMRLLAHCLKKLFLSRLGRNHLNNLFVYARVCQLVFQAIVLTL